MYTLSSVDNAFGLTFSTNSTVQFELAEALASEILVLNGLFAKCIVIVRDGGGVAEIIGQGCRPRPIIYASST